MKTIKAFLAGLSILVGLSVGASAQTSLTALDGSKVDIQGQRNKVVILAVGASWLPLSAKQADFANMLANKYRNKDVAVYFVVIDSLAAKSKNYATNKDVQKFVTANKLNVVVLRDGDGIAILKKFNIDQVPSFVILDKSGQMVGQPFGGIDPKYDISVPISKEVDKLL
ncbi:MAG TPA: TlpA disulfide reductase family protein [Pyrinomonadaceae bacterium]|nr:TlpA disulfide reductase family protein [Pyrinomonadaceae bacterium]